MLLDSTCDEQARRRIDDLVKTDCASVPLGFPRSSSSTARCAGRFPSADGGAIGDKRRPARIFRAEVVPFTVRMATRRSQIEQLEGSTGRWPVGLALTAPLPPGADELTVRYLQSDAAAHGVYAKGLPAGQDILVGDDIDAAAVRGRDIPAVGAIKAMGSGLAAGRTEGATGTPAVQRVTAQLKPDGGIVGIGRRDCASPAPDRHRHRASRKASCASGMTSRFRCCLRGDGG